MVDEIDKLLELMTGKQIAQELNAHGIRPPESESWSAQKVGLLRRSRGLKSRFDRLRERGLLTDVAMGTELGVTATTVRIRYIHGLLTGSHYNDKGGRLYEPPRQDNVQESNKGSVEDSPPDAHSHLTQHTRCSPHSTH